MAGPRRFVILDASPVDDIRNTRRIHWVIHRGVVIDREALLGGKHSDQGVE